MKLIKNYIEPYKSLPKSIYVIFFASIVNHMGNFVGPFITMFLTYKMGLDSWVVGTIVALNSLLGLLGAMMGGKLIDQIGRKKILVIFRTAAGLGYAMCAFTDDPIIITCILMISSFLGGFSQPVYNTIITDLTEGEQRKSAFSLNYMALNIGFSVGPLLAGFLYKNYLTWLFLGDAITTFASILLVLLFVPETKPTKEELEKAQNNTYEKVEEGSLIAALIKRPTLLMFSFIIAMFFAVFSQFHFGLPLQIGEIFGDDVGATMYGSLGAINAVICSVFTIVITSVLRDRRPSFNIVIGGLFYGLGFGMIFFINSYFMFIASTIIWTIGEILVSTNTSVFIANHTPITHRGRFNSVFPIIRRIGSICGPMIAGFYVKVTEIRNLWILVCGMSLIATMMMYRLYLLDIKKENVSQTETV